MLSREDLINHFYFIVGAGKLKTGSAHAFYVAVLSEYAVCSLSLSLSLSRADSPIRLWPLPIGSVSRLYQLSKKDNSLDDVPCGQDRMNES